MTQAVIGIDAVAAAMNAVDAAEPTIEELAALVGDPIPEPVAEPVPGVDAAEAEGEDAAAKPVPATEPTEADAALERAAKAAAKAREGSRRYAEMQAQQREQAEMVQRAAREAEQLRRENAAAKAREDAYKKDPYKALKDAGMTDRDLAERAIRENTPEAEMVRLRERVEAAENARIALEQRLEKQAQEQRNATARAKAHADLVQATEDEASCPGLSQLTPEGRLDTVRLALARIEANGHSTDRLTLPQIVEAGEAYLKMTRKAAKATAAAVTTTTTTKPKPSGKTLTNAQAQTRTVAPGDWDSLSDEQQIAHIAAALPDPT